MFTYSTIRLSLMIMLPLLLVAAAFSAAPGGPSAYYFEPPEARATAAYPNGPITRDEVRRMIDKVDYANQFLQEYWGRQFAEHGLRFVAPRVELIRDRNNAYYYSPNHTIYIDPVFFVRRQRAASAQTETDGDMASIIIFAHEYGHAAQRQLGKLRGASINVELQADCMAGAFARAADRARLLDPGDFDEATYTFFSGRDATHTPAGHAQAHGTGSQRVAAFHRGADGGPEACGCFRR